MGKPKEVSLIIAALAKVKVGTARDIYYALDHKVVLKSLRRRLAYLESVGVVRVVGEKLVWNHTKQDTANIYELVSNDEGDRISNAADGTGNPPTAARDQYP